MIDPTASGNSIYIHGTVTNLTGGLFYSQINQNALESILGQYIGDTVAIEDNYIQGANTSIDVSQISGAGGFRVSHNTLVGTKGSLIIRSGVGPHVEDNTMEQIVNSTETNGAVVDLTGDIASIWHPRIVKNRIQVNAGITGVTQCVNVGVATASEIDGNRISIRGGFHVVIGASASATVVGPANQYVTNDVVVTANISDSGTATGWTVPVGKLTTKAIVPDADNGWALGLGGTRWANLFAAALTSAKFQSDATGVGFYGHATVAQPAAPVTLADVIAIIRGCGLSA